jgi:hypothetical protein
LSTVAQLINQTYRDWLTGAADQPVRGVLDTTITDSDTTVLVNLAALAADEQDAFALGVVVELERELVYVTDVTVASNVATLTVVRAANGTTAATHSSGTYVYPSPTYARQSVFDAICDEVVGLWPELYALTTQTVTIGTSYTEVSALAEAPQKLYWMDGSAIGAEMPELLKNFPPSSTTRAIVTQVAPPGKTGYFTYRAKFARPSSESVDLVATTGLDQSWERIVAIGAVASIISGVTELDPLTSEFIAEQLARETTPTGTSGQLVTRLLRLRNEWITRAQRQLRARDRHPVSFMPLAGV